MYNDEYRIYFDAAETIRESRYIVIAGHENPDGDAVGSALGLYYAILQNLEGPEVFLYTCDSVPESLQFLEGVELFQSTIPWYPDLVIGVDYGDFHRLGIPSDFLDGARIVTFDHHPISGQRGDIKLIDIRFSSTAELVYVFLQVLGWRVSKQAASALLTGIITDTAGFSHNTSSGTLRAVGELIQYGASLDAIRAKTMAGKSSHVLNVWGALLKHIQRDPRFGCVSICLSLEEFQRYGIVLDDLTGLVGVLNIVEDARFSFLAVEYEHDRIKGSFRSDTFKDVDVSSIAKRLGGGGHKYAAGFALECSLEEAHQRITQAIQENLVHERVLIP